jgi:hypothetical protein
MTQVLIILNANQAAAPIEQTPGIHALQQAIAADPTVTAIELVTADAVAQFTDAANTIFCPLTLATPEQLGFPGQRVFRACRDISLRQRVEQWGYAAGTGEFWLPIVLTAKGALYAEVIALAEGRYFQPLHLSDRWRQPLYHLGQRLLDLLVAPPAVYLLQFGFLGETVCFDRLLPFPDLPATASIGVQTPDLYECHWRCLTDQAIVDLAISEPVAYQIYDPIAVVAKG